MSTTDTTTTTTTTTTHSPRFYILKVDKFAAGSIGSRQIERFAVRASAELAKNAYADGISIGAFGEKALSIERIEKMETAERNGFTLSYKEDDWGHQTWVVLVQI